MKTLEEHNKEQEERYRVANGTAPRANGIACPDCGKELMDSCPVIILTSMPPQKNIHCPYCGYRGYRSA